MVECNIESGSRLGVWTPTPPFTPIGFAPRKHKYKTTSLITKQEQQLLSSNKGLDFQVLWFLEKEFNYSLLSLPLIPSFYQIKVWGTTLVTSRWSITQYYCSAHLPELLKQAIYICCHAMYPCPFLWPSKGPALQINSVVCLEVFSVIQRLRIDIQRLWKQSISYNYIWQDPLSLIPHSGNLQLTPVFVLKRRKIWQTFAGRSASNLCTNISFSASWQISSTIKSACTLQLRLQ